MTRRLVLRASVFALTLLPAGASAASLFPPGTFDGPGGGLALAILLALVLAPVIMLLEWMRGTVLLFLLGGVPMLVLGALVRQWYLRRRAPAGPTEPSPLCGKPPKGSADSGGQEQAGPAADQFFDSLLGRLLIVASTLTWMAALGL